MITVLPPADKNKLTTSPGLGLFHQKPGKLGHSAIDQPVMMTPDKNSLIIKGIGRYIVIGAMGADGLMN